MNYRQLRTLSCAGLATLATLASIRAQTTTPVAADQPATEMDKFIVQSVAAPTANAIADKQQIALQQPASSVINAIKFLPGVNLSQGDAFGGDDWSTRLTIRGFNENQLGFTIDGVGSGFTNYSGGAKPNRYVDIDNVGSVIVSQGAADISSASSQALGGTLAYFTDDPAESAGLQAKYTFGDFNTSRVFFRADTGKFGGSSNSKAYVSFSSEQNDNWVGHYVGGDAAVTKRLHSDFKDISQLGNVKLTVYAAIDNVNPEINYQGVTLQQFAQDPHNDHLTFRFVGDPNTDQNYAPTWTTIRTNSLVYTKFDVPVGDDFNISFQPYWAHQQGKGQFLPPYQIRRYDLNGNPSSVGNYTPANKAGTVFFADGSGADIQPVNPITGAAPANPYDINTYTWLTPAQMAAAKPLSTARFSRYVNNRYGDNLSFELKLGSANKLHFGMWNEDQERERYRTWHAVINPLVNSTYNAGDYSETFHWKYRTLTNMFYIDDQFTLDKLTLTAGAKYFNVKVKTAELLLQADGTPGFSTEINSNSKLLPSVGAVYKLDASNELFASYTRNFSAVQDAILEAGASGVDVSKVKPENADNYDLGYRYSSHNFALSATGYYIKYTDKIVSLSGLAAKDYTNTSSGVYVNIGGTESYGTELAAHYLLGSGFSLLASFSYTHAIYTATTPDGTITKGKTVVDTPETIASYGLLYNHSGFSGGLVAKSTGKRFGTYSNDNAAPSYTVLDLNVGYTRMFSGHDFFKSATVGFAVTNLLDKSYLGNVSINDQDYLKNDPTGTSTLWTIGAPRTITFSFGVGF